MRTLLIAAAATAVLAGCASAPESGPQPGTLVVGTAQVRVNNADAATTTDVRCTVAGPLTTITTGDGESGVSALVSNADGLVAKWVTIRDLGGFTGSFEADLQGEAKVTRTGRTYDITGSADGFDTDRPSFRSSGTFAVTVAC